MCACAESSKWSFIMRKNIEVYKNTCYYFFKIEHTNFNSVGNFLMFVVLLNADFFSI